MSSPKDHELTGNLHKVYRVLLQSGAKGIRATEIAEKAGIDKTTVYSHLNTLRYMGRAESEQGIWCAKAGKQANKHSEKEIVIELPMPKDEWRRIAFLEAQARDLERVGSTLVAEDIKILLEKFKETRTIRIKGKNVDDLDLEKAANLIQQANEKASRMSLKGLLKTLGKSRANKLQRE
jgi:sugar-specific transcriptional regulator TrmB